MVYCEGMGIAHDSIYQHDTLLDVICSTLLLLSMWIDTLIKSLTICLKCLITRILINL